MNKGIRGKNARELVRGFVLVSCLFTAVTVIIGHSTSRFMTIPDTDVSADVNGSGVVVVIDPGHGGEDGGAVAADGTLEKDLNLEFSKTLYTTCRVLGIDCVMTRDTDTLLYDKYDDLEDYRGKKKVYDLRNRLRIAEEQGNNTVFVSIHMNKFPDTKYSGTQIYYSANHEESEQIAQLIQGKITASLQPDNDREIKKSGSSIFLLKRISVPAVLVECGFLSNEAETLRLCSTEYKKEFSLATAVAIGEFISQ